VNTTRVQAGESLIEARQRLERALQARHATAQKPAGRLHVAHELQDLLTVSEGARLARFEVTAPGDPIGAFRKWLRREAIPVLRRGRILLIERRVLLAALRG
jgi:hypothetical protein